MSKSWNYVATEYLYRKVVLGVRSGSSQLAAFEACVELGAARHLRHTRSLIIYDAPDFALYYGHHDLEDKPVDVLAQQEAKLRILWQLPTNKLGTFQ